MVLSFLCLGSWANTFKAAGSRWRFELFSIDFAVGALLFSVLAAFTLGTLGADLGFSDRMLVAGRLNQALAFGAGTIFALGSMLLLAAVSLLGMSAAFPLSIGSAMLVAALLQFRSADVVWWSAGVALLLVALIFDMLAIRSRKSSIRPAASKPGVRPPAKKTSNWTKGIVVGVISGLALGCFFPIINRSFRGDFGLGPYAGLLLMSIGLLAATMVLNLYFMNIAISGGPIGFGAYFTGLPHQHFLGFAGGAIWALGMLAQGMAMSAPGTAEPDPALRTVMPLASVVLAVFWGLAKWKEFAAAPGAKLTSGRPLLVACAIAFLGGAVLIGLAVRS